MRKGKQMMVAVVLLSAATAAMAVDRYVSPTGLHQNGYTNWTDAATNVQDAVNAAASGETIWVTNGHYVCTSPVSVSYNGGSSLTMILFDKAVTLQSVNGYEVTTLDAAASSGAQRHVIATTASATVDGFTITGGYVTSAQFPTWPHYMGGGVLRAGSGSPVIQNCLIAENYGANGGSGLGWIRGGLAVDCVISNNTGSSGTRLREGGRLRRCEVINHAPPGVWIQDAGGIVENCIIRNNGTSGSTHGAGVYMSNGGTVRNSLLYDNIGKRGAGIYMYYSAGMSPAVQNCTIVDNYVSSSGGGIYFNDAAGAGTDGSVQNCIITGNSAGGYSPDVHPPTGTVKASYNYSTYDFSPYGTGNIVGSDPQFVDAGPDNYQLKRSSPCVDKGTNATWITSATVDLAGQTRRYWTHVDIGAYEFVPEGTLFMFR